MLLWLKLGAVSALAPPAAANRTAGAAKAATAMRWILLAFMR
ncbi:MAG TPA: hypothetical protein VNW94_03310 [Streptosporangiaceae bacterium]|nr:hypothetical protein [Streptosporangiaceae bacterium]